VGPSLGFWNSLKHFTQGPGLKFIHKGNFDAEKLNDVALAARYEAIYVYSKIPYNLSIAYWI
jgi:hypothetical protein